jgi:hypothetical protein
VLLLAFALPPDCVEGLICVPPLWWRIAVNLLLWGAPLTLTMVWAVGRFRRAHTADARAG